VALVDMPRPESRLVIFERYTPHVSRSLTPSVIFFVIYNYQGIKCLILLLILQMSISINGSFRFDINNFK